MPSRPDDRKVKLHVSTHFAETLSDTRLPTRTRRLPPLDDVHVDRTEMSLRGFADRGRPPLFTTARDRASSVRSGSSLYSWARMECASTLARSDFKVRRETGFLTIVGLSHAEYVARGAARGVTDYDEPPGEQSIARNRRAAQTLAEVET